MTTIAPTTADLRETLRRLAETEHLELPILSVYLDVRPEATGQSPGRRVSFTVLRDRLREIEATYWPRGADYDSFVADRDRIEAFLDDELDPATQGVALFACSAIGLWEVIQAGVPFRDSVAAGPRPDLFQLARLIDEHRTAVIAVVDSNTARLFVSRSGAIEERDGPDEGTESFRKREVGGWSQARYQRHIDKHIADFAATAAAEIERLVEREAADRLVLAGDEVAIGPLTDALSQAVRRKVTDVARIGIRATKDEIDAEVRPILDRFEGDEGSELADRVVGLVRGNGLAVAGVRATRSMLEAGAVDTLVMVGLPGDPPEQSAGHDARSLQDRDEIAEEAEDRPLDLEARNDLVRLATLTAAAVEVVATHPALEHAGGVGALLRYRPD